MFAGMSGSVDHVAAFGEHRSLLFSIAYRMLGSVADAEDVLQDAYLKWERAGEADVRSPRDYLATTVTRLAVDHLRSARVRREVYVGPWLPEPLVGVDARDPLAAATLAESLSTAFLVLLERLTPTQRAAFLLREVFDYEYADVARILEETEANARQLVQRAKRHIAEGRSRFEPTSGRANELARSFLDACRTGDTDTLVDMLAADAVAWADGGGKFSAARRPINGIDRVARFVGSVVAKWRDSGSVTVEPVNGGIGLLFRTGDRLRAVLTVGVDPDSLRVNRLFIQVNPEKLECK
jgi:RNA polymerase sigma-70 factor (ECF subfamily)